MNAIYLMLAVGIPVLLLFGGALLAFAVAHTPADSPVQPEPTVAEQTQPAAPAPLVFFQPVGWTDTMQQATADEIVASIEAHLKAERRAAQSFVKDPSNQTLWVD